MAAGRGRTRRRFAAALVTLLLLVAACGGPPRGVERPRPDYREASRAELVERANAWTSSSVLVEGRLRLFWAGTEDSDHVDVRLVGTRTGALVLEGRRSIVGNLFRLVADGFDFRLTVFDHEAVYTGDATVTTEPYPERPYLSLRPRHITEALLPEPLPTTKEQGAGDVVLETYPDRYVLHWAVEDADGRARPHRRVVIERLALKVARIEAFDDDGRIDFIAVYSAWPDDAPGSYPGAIRVERPWEDLVFALEVESARPGAPLPAAALDAPPPDGYRVLPIQEAIRELRARDGGGRPAGIPPGNGRSP